MSAPPTPPTLSRPERATLLAGLVIDPEALAASTKKPGGKRKPRNKTKASTSPPPPSYPRAHFLPGESRANCGPAGFTELKTPPIDPRAYRRKLYANSEPRNLVPPQFLTPEGRVTSERKRHDPLSSREWVLPESDAVGLLHWNNTRTTLLTQRDDARARLRESRENLAQYLAKFFTQLCLEDLLP